MKKQGPRAAAPPPSLSGTRLALRFLSRDYPFYIHHLVSKICTVRRSEKLSSSGACWKGVLRSLPSVLTSATARTLRRRMLEPETDAPDGPTPTPKPPGTSRARASFVSGTRRVSSMVHMEHDLAMMAGGHFHAAKRPAIHTELFKVHLTVKTRATPLCPCPQLGPKVLNISSLVMSTIGERPYTTALATPPSPSPTHSLQP